MLKEPICLEHYSCLLRLSRQGGGVDCDQQLNYAQAK